MRNKIILLAVILGLCVNIARADSFDIGDYRYIISETEPNAVSVKLTPTAQTHISSIKNITIPENVTNENTGETYIVTQIRASGFSGCVGLKSVSLPTTLTVISDNAFRQCDHLTSIVIPMSVTTISYTAFTNTSSMETILFEGVTAPSLVEKLSNVRSDLEIQVLSTAAKENFLVSNWRSSVASDDAIVVVPVEINEETNNSSTLEYHAGHTADVELTRTIKAGGYNTLCLPFAVSAEQVTAVFGSGCDIQELTSATVSASGIDLQFTQRTAMDAGKPYLVKPLSEVSNPTFTSVVLTDETTPSETANVDFIGIFSPTEMMASDNTLIMGSGSTLHPTASETMNGFRGYFTLKTVGAKTAAKKQINLIYSTTETPTDIAQYPTTNDQRLTTKSQKLIINGQLLILRDGIYYNAQGIKVK